jgi:predicted Zn-dependent peptidase
MREEVRRWILDGVAGNELTTGKNAYAEEFHSQLTDDAFVASRLTRWLEIDRTFAFDSAMREKIESLSEFDIQRALQRHLGRLRWAEIKAGDFR